MTADSTAKLTSIDFYLRDNNHYYAANFVEAIADLCSKLEIPLNYGLLDRAELNPELQTELIRHGLFFVFKACLNSGDSIVFVLDPYDKPSIETGIYEKVDIYFKVNLTTSMIASYPRCQSSGPVFPMFGPAARKILLKKLFSSKPSLSTARALRRLVAMPTEDNYRQWRKQEKKWDVYFVTGLYPEKELIALNRDRYELVKEIRRTFGDRACAGLVSNNTNESGYRDAIVPRVSIDQHLQRMAQSKICIFTRGVADCISFKFGQLCAMGAVPVGQRPAQNVWPYDKLPMQNYLFTDDNPQSICERAMSMLKNEHKLDQASVDITRYYEQTLSTVALSARLSQVISAQSRLITYADYDIPRA